MIPAPRFDRRLAEDGIEVAMERRPATGPGPHILLAHATGFCKEVWLPVVAELDELGSVGSITTFDQRAHGASDAPDHPFEWEDLGRDALAVVSDLEGPLVGVGHSSGGALLVLAEMAQPGRFAALVLIEPIIFPPPHRRDDDSPLALATSRRRSRFRSIEEARANYVGKGAFARWRRDALDAYLSGGLRREGEEYILACDPRDEAEFYRSGSTHRAWNYLPELPAETVLMAGADSTTHPGPVLQALADRMIDPVVEVVPDATHFLPMELPDVVAATVFRVVQSMQTGNAQ